MARAVLRKRRKHVAPYLSKAGAHASRGARFSTEPARPASGTWCGDWPHGWQYHASRTLTVHSRDHVRLPSLPPSSRALLRSQAGPHAGPWLTAIPCDTATNIPPQAMQVALRHRLRLPLPVARMWWSHGCFRRPCPRLPENRRVGQTSQSRRACLGPRGASRRSGRASKQWLAHTTAAGIPANDRRCTAGALSMAPLPMEEHCAAMQHWCSPLTRTGHPHPCTIEVDGLHAP